MKPLCVEHVTMAAIRTKYRELNPGGHWFSTSTMRFFNTELPQRGFLDLEGSYWFITGETNPSRIKRYSIRRMDASGDIDTVGQFHWYTSRGNALEALYDRLKETEEA